MRWTIFNKRHSQTVNKMCSFRWLKTRLWYEYSPIRVIYCLRFVVTLIAPDVRSVEIAFRFSLIDFFLSLLISISVCEVKYCSSCRFTGATISTSRICFFKRRLTLLTTTVTHFFVIFKKKKKKERRKTTDNDLSLLRMSLWHETSTAILLLTITRITVKCRISSNKMTSNMFTCKRNPK